MTLQIARMVATRYAAAEGPLRFRYSQRVFREAEGDMQAMARELTQIGIECIGVQGAEADAEVVGLFAEALERSGVAEFKLAVATVGVLRALLARSGGADAWQESVLSAYHASNFIELDRITDPSFLASDPLAAGAAPAYAAAIRALPRIRGGKDAIARARELAAPLGLRGRSRRVRGRLRHALRARARRVDHRRFLRHELVRLLHGHRVRGVRACARVSARKRRALRQYDRRIRRTAPCGGICVLPRAGDGGNRYARVLRRRATLAHRGAERVA